MTQIRPRAHRWEMDIETLDKDAELSEVIDLTNKLIERYNFVLKALSFQSNFNGLIVDITIPATSDLAIQHFLGVKPKFRVILRQEGNGVISDIPSGWNDQIITLRNNGAVTVTATILIARE